MLFTLTFSDVHQELVDVYVCYASNSVISLYCLVKTHMRTGKIYKHMLTNFGMCETS